MEVPTWKANMCLPCTRAFDDLRHRGLDNVEDRRHRLCDEVFSARGDQLPVRCQWIALGQEVELESNILAFINLFSFAVAQYLHHHGAIRWQLRSPDPKHRGTEAHPNPLARSYAEDAA